MNREIKFRAWDNGNGYMVTSKQGVFTALQHYMNITRQDNGYYNNGELLKPIKDKYILMQYTGLKDKNGVEIYEGDILENSITDSKCVVRFYDTRFMLAYLDRLEDVPVYGFMNRMSSLFAVIGNIYENEVTNVKD